MAHDVWHFLSVSDLFCIYIVFANITSAGGYYSTVNDLAKLGKNILLSRFLPKSVTDRWFKPSSFVEDWSAGVGRPWEIFRLKVNGQSVDAYTKSGDCK